MKNTSDNNLLEISTLERSYKIFEQIIHRIIKYPNQFCYLFFYDPNNQYLFKQSHARQFADVIGFTDDWGNANRIDLSVYYRMCEQVRKEIMDCPSLLETDMSRFTERVKKKGKFFPDTNKHH